MQKYALIAVMLWTAGTAQAGEWKKVSSDDGITIYNREQAGSGVKEVKAVGTINAPHWVCKNVIDDEAHYKDFMPYTEASDVLKQAQDVKYVYQRISAPLVSERDYTLAIRNKSFRKPDGSIVYKKVWSLANAHGPKPKDGVVRLSTNEGYWVFEDAGNNKTHATYYVNTNPGGSLPSWVANAANTRAIPNLFEAVTTQSKKPQYRKTKPALPEGVDAPPTTMAPAPPK